MPDRLTRIYTRTGDAGETGTAAGERVAKDDALISVQGELDELNCFLGLLVSRLDGTIAEILLQVQHDLFDIGGELSLGVPVLDDAAARRLEQHIDKYNAGLQPLKEFILPGGNEQGALCHVARAVCRRAERAMVSLSKQRELNPASLVYLNRLSDLLFVLARVLNGGDEVYWEQRGFNKDG